MFLVPMSRDTRHLARALSHMYVVSSSRRPAAAGRTPALDVSESDAAYSVKLEMPGVKKEDIKVTVEGRRVTVEAESKAETKPEGDAHGGDRIVYRERAVSSYARSFTLPMEVNQAGASAKLDDGVLALELPKRSVTTAAQLTVA